MNDALFDAKLKEALLAGGHHGLRRGAVGAGGDGVALNAALPPPAEENAGRPE